MHASWVPQARPPRADSRRRRTGRRLAARLVAISGLLMAGMLLALGAKHARRGFTTVAGQQSAPGGQRLAAAAADVRHPAAQSEGPTGRMDLATCRAAAQRLAPDIMQAIPQTFLESHSKTPCWDGGDGKVRCLPSFLLAGGFQSGAATLAAKLAVHQHIKTGPSSNNQFWAEFAKPASEYLDGFAEAAQGLDPQQSLIMDNSASTFAFYWSAGARAHPGFRVHMTECWANCSEAAAGDDARRDACVTDSCFPAAQAADRKVISEAGINFEEAHVPLLVNAAYGEWPVKLVVLLRNPIDRLWSSYHEYDHYKSKYGATPEGFAAYVDENLDAFEACSARHSATECALYFEALGLPEEKVFFHADQFIRGLHAVFLARWLRHIPQDRLLAVRAEDYFSDNERTVRRVLEFLHVTPPENMGPLLQAGQPHSHTAGQPPMLARTRERLQHFYQPYNQQLADLLSETKYAEWS